MYAWQGTPPVEPQQFWYRVTWLSVVAVLGLLFVVPLWPPVHEAWTVSSTYSHGYLVLALAAWLSFRAAQNLRLQSFSPSAIGFLALAGAASLALASLAAEIILVQQLAIFAVVFSALWAIAGWPVAKRFLAPIGYMVFAIPVWDLVNEPLRALTTSVAGSLTRQTSIPAFLQGNLIHLPSGTLEVAGGCSGLHYLIVSLALAALYGLQHYNRRAPQLILLAAAVVVALVANWIRVFTLVVVGHVTQMQGFLITVDHYYFGWVLFAVCVVPLMMLARHLEQWAGTAPGGTPKAVGITRHGNVVAILTVAVLAVGVWLTSRIANPAPVDLSATTIAPPTLEGWQIDGPWEPGGSNWPHFVAPTAEGAAWYRRGDERIGIYLATYGVQRQAQEVVFFANRPAGESARILEGQNRSVASIDERRQLPFRELIVADTRGRQRLVWFGMQVAGYLSADDILAKWHQVLGAVAGQRDAQVLVLTAECVSECSSERLALSTVASQFGSILYDCARSVVARGSGREHEGVCND